MRGWRGCVHVTQEIDRARAQCNITNITKAIWCGVCSCIVFYGVHVFPDSTTVLQYN